MPEPRRRRPAPARRAESLSFSKAARRPLNQCDVFSTSLDDKKRRLMALPCQVIGSPNRHGLSSMPSGPWPRPRFLQALWALGAPECLAVRSSRRLRIAYTTPLSVGPNHEGIDTSNQLSNTENGASSRFDERETIPFAASLEDDHADDWGGAKALLFGASARFARAIGPVGNPSLFKMEARPKCEVDVRA